jgi:trans-aconitate methyltransferase
MLQVHRPVCYVGIDFSEEALLRARQAAWPHCEFVTGNFETWRPTGFFDAIVFNEVVGYARDPGALVAAFLPFLTPTGSVLVSHFRSGHWVALWRRIERQAIVQSEATITNHLGQAWDIKVLRPRNR